MPYFHYKNSCVVSAKRRNWEKLRNYSAYNHWYPYFSTIKRKSVAIKTSEANELRLTCNIVPKRENDALQQTHYQCGKANKIELTTIAYAIWSFSFLKSSIRSKYLYIELFLHRPASIASKSTSSMVLCTNWIKWIN